MLINIGKELCLVLRWEWVIIYSFTYTSYLSNFSTSSTEHTILCIYFSILHPLLYTVLSFHLSRSIKLECSWLNCPLSHPEPPSIGTGAPQTWKPTWIFLCMCSLSFTICAQMECYSSKAEILTLNNWPWSRSASAEVTKFGVLVPEVYWFTQGTFARVDGIGLSVYETTEIANIPR